MDIENNNKLSEDKNINNDKEKNEDDKEKDKEKSEDKEEKKDNSLESNLPSELIDLINQSKSNEPLNVEDFEKYKAYKKLNINAYNK